MRQWAIVATAALLLTACSSSSGSGDNGGAGSVSATPTSPSASAAYTPAVGADAADIAGHIPSCSGVQSLPVGAGGPALTSVATCTLAGHLVIIDGFATASDSTISASLQPHSTFYAHGASWVAFLADEGADAGTTTLQLQLTNDAAGLTKQAIDKTAPPPVADDTQQALANSIAGSLGGAVTHVGS